MGPRDPLDPRGLIREAYALRDLGIGECRSVFLDWALGREGEPAPAIRALLERHGGDDHPMTSVLRAALDVPQPPRRRGGRAGRLK